MTERTSAQEVVESIINDVKALGRALDDWKSRAEELEKGAGAEHERHMQRRGRAIARANTLRPWAATAFLAHVRATGTHPERKAVRILEPILNKEHEGPTQHDLGLLRAAQIIFNMMEFYQHSPKELRALEDVRGAILREAGEEPNTQGSAHPEAYSASKG